jgi:hypothetical protein
MEQKTVQRVFEPGFTPLKKEASKKDCEEYHKGSIKVSHS